MLRKKIIENRCQHICSKLYPLKGVVNVEMQNNNQFRKDMQLKRSEMSQKTISSLSNLLCHLCGEINEFYKLQPFILASSIYEQTNIGMTNINQASCQLRPVIRRPVLSYALSERIFFCINDDDECRNRQKKLHDKTKKKKENCEKRRKFE